MNAFDISNVTATKSGGMYKIAADEGYYIHLPEHDENMYKRVVLLHESYDFGLVEVVAVEDLPEGAEIF